MLEHLPIEMISDQQAVAAGSTLRDIHLNRKADEFAKKHIHEAATKLKVELRTKEVDVFARQLWLSKLNRVCKKPEPVPVAAPAVNTAPAERLTSRQLCPRWAWDSQPAEYTWQACIDETTKGPEKPPLSGANFKTFLQFMKSLRWKLGDGCACSVFELAAAAFLQGWRFELPAGTICTPQSYASIIRAAISFCKTKQVIVAPLLLDKGNKCNGKTFPKGAFLGAQVYRGAKATPHSWAIPFDSLL